MRAKGHVFKYGDNVDTDVIIPARYLNSFDAKELASHAMADIDPEFAGKVQQGDLIVARKNFGCGSSREHAPLCLKTAGISCVIAETFARIFYRNAINIGLPIIECPQAAQEIEDGDEVEVDFDSGMIYDRTERHTVSGTGISGIYAKTDRGRRSGEIHKRSSSAEGIDRGMPEQGEYAEYKMRAFSKNGNIFWNALMDFKK